MGSDRLVTSWIGNVGKDGALVLTRVLRPLSSPSLGTYMPQSWRSGPVVKSSWYSSTRSRFERFL